MYFSSSAVANKKYFYHSYLMLLFALKYPVLRGFPGILLFASKMLIATILSKLKQVVTTC
jgi:hypothetical protein